MRFGICNLSIVAVRLEPSHSSEMVTQLLYGDLIEIIEKTDDWAKIKMLYDCYEGWIDQRQYLPLYNDNFENLSNFGSSITLDLVQVLVNETKNYMIPVVLGSTLPFVANKSFYFNDEKYIFEGNVRSAKDTSDKKTLLKMPICILMLLTYGEGARPLELIVQD